jgi:AcrR family transcriptional regulator
LNKKAQKREMIIVQLSQHLLAEGMQKSSLRTLAAAAGTSDRMLLHYFDNKEEMLTESLQRVADQLKAILDSARPDAMPYQDLIPFLATIIQGSEVHAFMRLWLELAALASGGEEPYLSISNRICEDFLSWIHQALIVEDEGQREAIACLVLSTIEGFVILKAVGASNRITMALTGLAETI